QHVVREVGDGDPGDAAQRGLVVERGGQHAAGLGQERRAAPDLLGLGPRDLGAAALRAVLLEPPAVGHVANDRGDERAGLRDERAPADLGEEAAAVAAAAVDV